MMGSLPLLSSQLQELDDSILAIHQYESGERHQSWGYTIRQRRDGSFRLDVNGRGTDNWLPGLCNELYEEGINILSGHIYRVSAGAIRGTLTLEAGVQTECVLGIDVMECLANPAARGPSDSISLSSYAVEVCETHGGSIQLDIEGLDRRGFLSTFFGYLEPLGLNVVEARVSTAKRMVRDRFWLEPPIGDLARVPGKLTSLLEPLVDCYWAT